MYPIIKITRLTASPMKSGWIGVFKKAAATAAAVESTIEDTAHEGATAWGIIIARVNGRKIPPPRKAIER